MEIHHNTGAYAQSYWGLVAADVYGRRGDKLGTTINSKPQDGKHYIPGSDMYFDEEKNRLHGKGWVLEYRVTT